METEIITSHKELVKMVKDGHFFNFCVGFALNKGFRDAIKEKKDVRFSVGDYAVEFIPNMMCFTFTHQVFFGRIIHAYPYIAHFVGYEEEVINDLLTELEKEK